MLRQTMKNMLLTLIKSFHAASSKLIVVKTLMTQFSTLKIWLSFSNRIWQSNSQKWFAILLKMNQIFGGWLELLHSKLILLEFRLYCINLLRISNSLKILELDSDNERRSIIIKWGCVEVVLFVIHFQNYNIISISKWLLKLSSS